eukprot:m.41636 g.41636  ORF g.41636 m.41636 type:complete len:55 (-) comp11844_c0_seq3:1087-1251(-)
MLRTFSYKCQQNPNIVDWLASCHTNQMDQDTLLEGMMLLGQGSKICSQLAAFLL